MLTDCAEDASIAACENANALAKFMFGWKGIDRSMYEIACRTVFVFSNYSTRFSNDDFSSFTNSTKEARLLRNDIL